MKVEEIKLAFENNQKFELALIDDIAKMNNNSMTIDNVWKAYQDYLTKADAPFKRMISAYDAVTRVEGDSKALSANQIKGYDALNAKIQQKKYGLR